MEIFRFLSYNDVTILTSTYDVTAVTDPYDPPDPPDPPDVEPSFQCTKVSIWGAYHLHKPPGWKFSA